MKPEKHTYVIAETAQSHDGSLGILHSYIDALKDTGIDAVKFQVHIASAESSSYEEFRVNFSYADKTRFDYWKRMEFSLEQWNGIKKHCGDAGLEFLASPFSVAAFNYLEQLGVKKYKIASGEVTDYLLLDKIAATAKPVIVSTGLVDFDELDDSVSRIRRYHNDISLMQCTTKYPSPAEETGLNVLSELKERYKLPAGISDHSGTIYPALAAAALGAELIEVHAVFDKKMFGPDSASSLTISEIKTLAEGVRFIDAALNNPVNKNKNKNSNKIKFEKSIAVNRNLKKGNIVKPEDLESKKPGGMGIPSKLYTDVAGRKLSRDIEKNNFLTEDDLA